MNYCIFINFVYIVLTQIILFAIFLNFVLPTYISSSIQHVIKNHTNYIVDTLYQDISEELSAISIKHIFDKQIQSLEIPDKSTQIKDKDFQYQLYYESIYFFIIFLCITLIIGFVHCLNVKNIGIEILFILLILGVICLIEYIIIEKMAREYIFININVLRKSIGNEIIDYASHKF